MSDRGEGGRDAKDGVERIGLSTSLGGLGVSGSLGRSARRLRGRIGTTAVGELVTDELSDDVDVLCGAVVVRS